MLAVPTAGGSSGMGLVGVIALLIFVGGPIIVFLGLPFVRERAKNDLAGPRTYFYGPPEADLEEEEEDELEEVPTKTRREIDNFDLNIFRRE